MEKSKLVAIDCEMVGGGPRNIFGARGRDLLARVSIVDGDGYCVLDKYVKPNEPVINYRTEISGIRKKDLQSGESFYRVRDQVEALIQGKLLIGHSLEYDLGVLRISHPENNIRDTALYPPFLKMNKGKTPSLKKLALSVLGKTIQTGEHDSVDDAKTAMQLYKAVADKWEQMYR